MPWNMSEMHLFFMLGSCAISKLRNTIPPSVLSTIVSSCKGGSWRDRSVLLFYSREGILAESFCDLKDLNFNGMGQHKAVTAASSEEEVKGLACIQFSSI